MPPMTTTAAGIQTQLESLPIPPTLTLRLRAPSVESRRIHWAEDVIDNEGLGRKKSKVCCIYHKPRQAGESSSESDSSSDDGDDGSDDENDDGRARMAGKGKKTHKNCEEDGEGKGCDKGGRVKTKRKKRNGYETEPKRGGDKGKKTML